MAQPLTPLQAEDKQKKLVHQQRVLQSWLPRQATSMLSYSPDNATLLQNDSTLGSIYLQYLQALFNGGFLYRRDGAWVKPDTAEAKEWYELHMRGFAAKAFRYIFCNPVLHWFISRTDNNVMVPDVPDENFIEVIKGIHKTTGSSATSIKWKLDNVNSQLFSMDKIDVHGNGGSFSFCPVNMAKGAMFVLYRITQDRLVMGGRMANPEFILQYGRNVNGGAIATGAAGLSIYDIANNNSAISLRKDDEAVEKTISMRMAQRAIAGEVDGNAFATAADTLDLGERVQQMIDTPINSNTVTVPYELEHVSHQGHYSNTDVTNERRQLLSEIYAAIGVNQQRLQDYYWYFHKLLTTVNQIMHEAKTLAVAQVQATYQNEKRATSAGARSAANTVSFTRAGIKPVHTEIFLAAHVHSDIEMCLSMVEQKAMTPEMFMALFTPAQLPTTSVWAEYAQKLAAYEAAGSGEGSGSDNKRHDHEEDHNTFEQMLKVYKKPKR